MSGALNDTALDQLFRSARTHNGFKPEPIPEATLRALYDLLKWGPTSANCSPARFIFVTSAAAKEKLKPALSAGNLAKTMSAPATVIVAHDLDFGQRLGVLFPHAPGAKDWFADPAVEQTTAFRNGTLQGAYLIMAARSLGLDTGAMSGFDNATVDAAFFAGTRIKSNFLINLGVGDPSALFERSPRLAFEDACTIA